MIAGSYYLHIYCDREDDCAGKEYAHASAANLQVENFQSRPEAIKYARRRGWLVNWRAGKALCPSCKKGSKR